MRDDLCVDFPGAKNEDQIIALVCHGHRGNQEWIYHYNTVLLI